MTLTTMLNFVGDNLLLQIKQKRMSQNKVSKERYCKNCGTWGYFEGKIDDRCIYCGNMFEPKRYQEEADKEVKRVLDPPAIILVKIKKTDNFFVKIFKTVLQGFQLLFVAILTFVLWLVALISG
jgi:hypothetical protein